MRNFLIKILRVNKSEGPLGSTTNVWGLLPDDITKSNVSASIEKYYNPSEIIGRMRNIGKRSGLILKAYSIGETSNRDKYNVSSIMLKFYGSDNNTIDFMNKLKKEQSNYVIIKIAAVPDTVKNIVQIAFNLEIFMP